MLKDEGRRRRRKRRRLLSAVNPRRARVEQLDPSLTQLIGPGDGWLFWEQLMRDAVIATPHLSRWEEQHHYSTLMALAFS